MKKRTFDGKIIKVDYYSSSTESINVYDTHMNRLETVQRIIYKDTTTNDLLVTYGGGLRYVSWRLNGYIMVVNIETLPINPIPLQRAY